MWWRNGRGHMGPGWYPGLVWCLEPCLGPWYYHNWGLCWCPCPMWTPRPQECLGSWTPPVAILGLNLVTGHHSIWPQASASAHVWAHGPMVARICVDVNDFRNHWRLCRWLRYGHTPESMLMSEGYADVGAMLIWIATAATQGHSDIWVWAAL